MSARVEYIVRCGFEGEKQRVCAKGIETEAEARELIERRRAIGVSPPHTILKRTEEVVAVVRGLYDFTPSPEVPRE